MDTHDIEEQIMIAERDKIIDLMSKSSYDPFVFTISGRVECLFELEERMQESIRWLGNLRKDDRVSKEYIKSVMQLLIKRKELIDEYYRQIFKTVADELQRN